MLKQTRLIMGMPITVEVIDKIAPRSMATIFDYFRTVDKRYSTYKKDSEISRINNGLDKGEWSTEMKNVLRLCELTKQQTNGYFDIDHGGKRDPSGLVKGWAIYNAAKMLLGQGYKDFYIEAGGDIQAQGQNSEGQSWSVGIRNPFKLAEIIKALAISGQGVATSGTYIRGQHIYDPHNPNKKLAQVQSLTVIGQNIYEADRFATAAFAMGAAGINFIESIKGLEGYLVDNTKTATYTSGFKKYTADV